MDDLAELLPANDTSGCTATSIESGHSRRNNTVGYRSAAATTVRGEASWRNLGH